MKFKLSQFEGPLDVLLHLISQSKIDIKDIFVSDITEQYIQFLNQLDEFDMDNTSEFLAMAATLLEIKSRSLLPKPGVIDPDEEDPEQALIRRLTEYKAIKEMSQELKKQEDKMLKCLYKLPEELYLDQRLQLEDSTLSALMEAFQEVLDRLSVKHAIEQVREVQRDRFSVRKKILFLTDKLSQKKKMIFTQLFEQDCTKPEVVATFMAMLELWRDEKIAIAQERLFEDIYLYWKECDEHERVS